MNKLFFFGLIFIHFITSCDKRDEIEVEGKRPIYISKQNFEQINAEPAKSFTKVGKIFTIGNRIFISDVNSGVHIINNTDPSSPSNEAFVNILGNNDIAVRDNIMYADNGNDLVAIDITDVLQVKVEKRLKSVYNFNSSFFPLDHFGYFECVEEEKGIAYDWVDAKLINPKCHR